MEILILNWKDIRHPQAGGAEIIVYELAKRLVADGHKITWFSKGKHSEEYIDGIKMVRRGNLVTTYLYAPLYYWSLKQKPDLVIDMSNTIYWQSPLWAGKSKKIAYLNQFAKQVFFYEFPPIISHFGYLVEILQYLTYRRTKFICYSNGTKKDLLAVGIPERNIYQFKLGLDQKRYVPGIKSSYPLFLCASRLVKMKRTDLVIKAMALLVKKYPKVKLAISGTGYHQIYLEKLCKNLNLEKDVTFVNKNVWFFSRNTKDQKVKLMQQAWALVYPSVKEGWGMTVTECGACGTPTIATNVTGLQDSVINGKTGMLIRENPTPKDLADAMEKIIKDKNLREVLGKNAREYAKGFTWENSYRQFKQLVLSS